MDRLSAPGLIVTAHPDAAELLAWDLTDLGAVAVETRDATTLSGPSRVDAVVLIAGFEEASARDAALLVLSTDHPELEICSQDIVDDGWSEGWKKFFAPVELDGLRVITPWMASTGFDGITLVIDPGQAFGTGGHATTRLVLEYLVRMAREGQIPRRVLDVGAGSGVLAIGAVRLGAEQALAVDIDELATRAVEENAARNGVGKSIEARTAVPADLDGQWPLALANIQLAVFADCAADITRLVAPGGRLIVSGILLEQKDDCLNLFSGFEVEELREREGWLGLLLRRKAS